MAATQKPKLSYLGNIWPKFYDVNINFIYLNDKDSIFIGLEVIGIKLHVLVYIKMSKMTHFVKYYAKNRNIKRSTHLKYSS